MTDSCASENSVEEIERTSSSSSIGAVDGESTAESAQVAGSEVGVGVERGVGSNDGITIDDDESEFSSVTVLSTLMLLVSDFS